MVTWVTASAARQPRAPAHRPSSQTPHRPPGRVLWAPHARQGHLLVAMPQHTHERFASQRPRATCADEQVVASLTYRFLSRLHQSSNPAALVSSRMPGRSLGYLPTVVRDLATCNERTMVELSAKVLCCVRAASGASLTKTWDVESNSAEEQSHGSPKKFEDVVPASARSYRGIGK